MAPELDPIAPEAAVELYLEHRKDDARTATRRTQRYALEAFLDWTETVGVENLNGLSGRDLLRFKTWHKNESDIRRISLNGNLGILRRFLQFCELIDAVEPELHGRVPLPNVPTDEEVNEFVPPDEHVEQTRDALEQFAYASRPHVEFELIADIGLRIGAVRAIDLGDINMSSRNIQLRHRPEDPETDGTPLKNGEASERLVNISSSLMEVIADYIDRNREESIDQYGREALCSTPNGRCWTTTIRRDVYKETRPCEYGYGCPPGREISACPATINRNASQCPVSFSPHPLRKWSIMRQLDEGVPKEYLSDRVDVSVPVLEKHYDQRSEERKSHHRREVLRNHLPEFEQD